MRIIVFTALLLGGCTMPTAVRNPPPLEHWATVWGASDSVPAQNSPGFSGQTLRLIVHTTTGGNQVRIKIANTFGSRPLNIGGASVGLQQSGAALVAGSNHPLTFSGQTSIWIPIGAYILSDPAPLAVSAQQNLAVSVFIPGDSGAVSGHPLALQTSFASIAGDFVARDDAEPYKSPIQTWPLPDRRRSKFRGRNSVHRGVRRFDHGWLPLDYGRQSPLARLFIQPSARGSPRHGGGE